MAPIMIVYGAQKLSDTGHFIKNPATIRLMHLIADGMTAPVWFAYANAIFQLGAGVAILLGLQTRLSATAIIVWLIPVTYFGHPFWAGIQPDFNEAQFYKNLAIIAAYMLIALNGAGRWSVDGLLFNRK